MRSTRHFLFVCGSVTTSMSLGDFLCQYIDNEQKPLTKPLPSSTSSPTSPSLLTRLFPSITPDSRLSSLPWWDYHRTLIMGLQGALISGPWGYVQYSLLEHFFAGRSLSAVVKKVATSVITAPVSISLTFTGLNFLHGRSFDTAIVKIQSDLPRTYLSGACYWPLVSAFNFRFTPLEYRPLFGSIAGVLWNIYLSVIANQPPKSVEPSETVQ
jgi:hypothetical protein